MTPRGTDWSLAFLIALLFTTGMLSLVSGRTSDAWVFTLHGIGGGALGLVTGWKLRRVWSRIVYPRQWQWRSIVGALATAAVAATLLSGVVWSGGGDLYVAGFNLLNWHIGLGVALSAVVALHACLRAKRPRRADLANRRQALHLVLMAGAAAAGWSWQRPLASAMQWRGARRRWTGSYEQGSFAGSAFPATSWVADRPRPLDEAAYRLTVGGLVASPLALPLAAIGAGATIEATLDCTGGFYSTQRWSGMALERLLAGATPLPTATHVRVVSHTGYRWSFPLDEARQMLLATAVGDEPLSQAHGAPVRLVAPGRRGFQWIKWVVRVELLDGPDAGAAASTVWSSFTPEGRGEV